jgi:type I restriction enzyme S subunit
LSSARFVAFANQLSEGDRPRVKWSQLSDYSMPLPPLNEQSVIVAAIEEQLSHVDAAVAMVQRADIRTRVLRAALLRSALHGTWPTARVGDVAHVGSGATPRRSRAEYWEGGTVPWVTSGQLTDPYVRKPAAWITEKALLETNVKLWPKHTLLVAMYGEGRTRGHCSELLIEATTNQACAAIVLQDESVSRDYLKLFFNASYEANRALASGGVQPNLSLGLIRNLRFPVPSRDEQREIVDRLGQQLSVVESLQAATAATHRRAALLRRSILEAAFSGRLARRDEALFPSSSSSSSETSQRP